MIDGKDLVKGEQNCYNCGCNLKPVCPGYEKPKMKIRAQKLHENAKLPVRAHPTDAGMDLFFCPAPRDDIPKQIESVLPHGSSLFPTGLKIEVPEGYMLEIKNKSGISSRRGLLVGACVVDRGYTGEIFVNLHNPSDRTQTIHAGQKIAQAVFVKIREDIEIVESENIYDKETSRGDGALGSTGEE
jgi:dUTP pyrophosphatase